MFGSQMFSPAIMSFLKQAGEAFAECTQAESAGKLNKMLDKYCHGARPATPDAPFFEQRCQIYTAKAFAAAHIDGQVTWGGVGTIMANSSAWPQQGLNTQGQLFLAYMLGFLYGSDLPADTHKSIEGFLPMAAKVAAAPDQFARTMGMDPSKMREMAAQKAGNLGDMMNMLKGNKE